MWIRPVASGANALGDLSGQYWNVAQSNLRTQEGDIARANAAEQNWNRWNANVANLQRSDESTQYDRQAQANAMVRRNFEWGIGRRDSQARDQLAATLDREKIAATLGVKQQDEAKDLAAIENAANNYTRTVAQKGSALDTAEAIWRGATAKLNSATSSVLQEFGDELIWFDSSKNVKAFVPKPQTDEAKTKAAQQAAAAANARVADIATQHTFAEDALGQATRTLEDLQKQLGNFHLGVDKRDGQWIIINPLAAPGKNEYRWTPPPSRGAMPASGESTLRTPGARWNAPPMEVQPILPPTAPPMAPVETSQSQAIRNAFPTPDAVRAAARNGQISRDQAIEILTTAF